MAIKIKPTILALIAVLITAVISFHFDSAQIPAEYQQCSKDDDCYIQPVGCLCCGSGDLLAHYTAANKAGFEQLKKLASCTDSQIKSCQATDCAMTSQPVAICRKNICSIMWRDLKP